MLTMNRRKTVVLGLVGWGFLILGSTPLVRAGLGTASRLDLWRLLGLQGTLLEHTAHLLHLLLMSIAAGVALASTGALIASLVNPSPSQSAEAQNEVREEITE
jgi:hypothetical protein